MRIIHVIPNLKKGGAERLVLNIVQELSKLPNIDVVLVTFSDQNDYPFLSKSITWKVIPSKFLPSLKSKGTIDVENLQNFIDDFNPDIVHSHLFESEIVLTKINFSAKVKRVFHFHDKMRQFRKFTWKTIVKKQLFTEYYERRLALSSYCKGSYAICVSEDVLEFALNVLPKKNEKKLLYNAIDLKRFTPSILSYEESVEITTIGSLVDNKAQELAIETIYVLKKRGENVILNILGDGPNMELLKAYAHKLNVEDNIVFHGKQDFPESFLKKSFIYLHTAKSESFGLVLIEAMACGLPIVTTDAFGNRSLIKEGENGFMIWERDAGLIADKIQFLIKNELVRNKMGESAIEFASNFGLESYVAKLVSVYQIS